MKRPMTALFLSLALASGGMTASALAHSKSDTTAPADGATVELLEEIVLNFTKPMRVTVMKVIGDAGDLTLTSEQGTDAVKKYVATPDDDVAAGDYTVEWRGLSADGHPMQGRFTFTVAE